MLNIVLFEPEIPPNTGNIIRLCANTGCKLHLIEPIAFELDDKRLRRAGLDYGEWKDLKTYDSWGDFLSKARPPRILAISTKGSVRHSDIHFLHNDYVVFGPESRGLPASLLFSLSQEHILRIPMQPDSRSLNLSNAAAVIVYEAWRQADFAGAQ